MVNQNPSRRKVLESIGGISVTGLAGTKAASAVTESDDVRRFGDVQVETGLDRSVKIQAKGRVEYNFSVTGLLAVEGGPRSAVSNGVASQIITDETHTFRFTGEFTEFSIDGDARILVDGKDFDVEAFPQNTLEISPSGEVTYDVSASGAISIDKGEADQPNARTAKARTSGTHEISYAGELTYFQMDGDATIRQNGSVVDSSKLLPSTHPHEFTAVTHTSEDTYTIDITQDCETRNGESVETDEEARFNGRTVGRYAGQVTAVEHPNGAHVEIDEMHNEIVARAPNDDDARINVETTKGLVVDHEAVDTADFSLSAGQEARAVPFGDVVQITINDLVVQLSRNAYPTAEDSAALQAAAKVERTDAFQRLTAIASGRVRYDAAGIAGEEVLSGTTTTVRSVEHQLANPRKGDSGVISIRQTPRRVEHAGVRYKRFDNDEVTIDALTLPIGLSTTKLRRETKTITVNQTDSHADTANEEYTAELFANTLNPEESMSSEDLGDLADQMTREDLRTLGFFSFLNDVKDLLTDIGADVYDAAKFLWDVLKGQLDKVAITSKNLIISSPHLIANIAEDLPSSNLSVKEKLAWRIKATPAVTLASLGSAGFFDALDTGTWCAGCVFLAIVARDVIASESASYLCVYIGPALPALVACIVAAEALIQFASQYFGYSDVKNELCGGEVVSAIDPC